MNKYFSHEQRGEEANAKLVRVYNLEDARANLASAERADAQAMGEDQPRQLRVVHPDMPATAINGAQLAADHSQAQEDFYRQEVKRHAA